MESHKLLLPLLLLGVWGCLGNELDEGFGEPILPLPHVLPQLYRNNIPQRCIDKFVADISCEGVSEDQLLPHPTDCNLFYYCVGSQPICRQCPANLHFNPNKHVCDYARRAGCRQY